MAIYSGGTRVDGSGGSTTIEGSGIISVNTITDLRGLTPAAGDTVRTRGYAAANDGGGGLFVWSSGAADDKMLSNATVNAGGTGYEVGDLIYITGGTVVALFQAFVRVATVSGSAVATVTIVHTGQYSATPGTTGIATTSRDGTGCTLNLTWVSHNNYGTYIPKAAGGTGRWVRQSDGSGRVSIMAFGAKGDGGDDWLAIQRAIWSLEKLYVPALTFNVSEALTFFNEHAVDIKGAGSRDGWVTSIINFTKNTDEPLIHPFGRYMKSNGAYQFETGHEVGGNNLGGVSSSSFNLRDLKLYSATSIYGSCCELTLRGQSLFENVMFYTTFRGLTLGQATFDVTVLHCSFISYFMNNFPWSGTTGGESNKTIARRAWGLNCDGHGFIYGSVGVGNGVAFRLTGAGISFSGARIEVNNYGILVANSYYALETEYGSSLSRSSISGVSLEANTIGFEIDYASDTTITGIGMQGSPPEGPRPDGEIGFYVVNMADTCIVSNVSAGGRFTRGAIVNKSRNAIHLSTGSGDTISYARTNSIFGTNGGQPYYRVTGFRNEVGSITTYHDMMHPHLSGLNIRDGLVRSRNFGDVAIPASGATSVNVTFMAALGYAPYAFSGLNTPADGASTLAAGTYYYAVTYVAKHAETGINYGDATIHSHRSLVVPSGSAAWVTFYGGAGSHLRRRIYRTAVNATIGNFEGYWEQASSEAGFYDSGQAFLRRGQPPEDGEIPSCVEPDANYRIIVTPSWSTTTWVSNISTTGFTINFGTAAPNASQSASWLMFRP